MIFRLFVINGQAPTSTSALTLAAGIGNDEYAALNNGDVAGLNVLFETVVEVVGATPPPGSVLVTSGGNGGTIAQAVSNTVKQFSSPALDIQFGEWGPRVDSGETLTVLLIPLLTNGPALAVRATINAYGGSAAPGNSPQPQSRALPRDAF